MEGSDPNLHLTPSAEPQSVKSVGQLLGLTPEDAVTVAPIHAKTGKPTRMGPLYSISAVQAAVNGRVAAQQRFALLYFPAKTSSRSGRPFLTLPQVRALEAGGLDIAQARAADVYETAQSLGAIRFNFSNLSPINWLGSSTKNVCVGEMTELGMHSSAPVEACHDIEALWDMLAIKREREQGSEFILMESSAHRAGHPKFKDCRPLNNEKLETVRWRLEECAEMNRMHVQCAKTGKVKRIELTRGEYRRPLSPEEMERTHSARLRWEVMQGRKTLAEAGLGAEAPAKGALEPAL